MIFLPFEKIAYANCPVCVLTVGGGLFIAKKLGIDDLLVSIWISGLNTAIAYWLSSAIKINDIEKRHWVLLKQVFKNPLNMSFSFYVMTLLYLWYSDQLNHIGNTFWGIDKVLFGMTVGFVAFVLAAGLDKLIRYRNNGKVLFYYQKVIIPIVFLVAVTVAFKVLL